MAVEATRRMTEHRMMAMHRAQRNVGMIKPHLRLQILDNTRARDGKTETEALLPAAKSSKVNG